MDTNTFAHLKNPSRSSRTWTKYSNSKRHLINSCQAHNLIENNLKMALGKLCNIKSKQKISYWKFLTKKHQISNLELPNDSSPNPDQVKKDDSPTDLDEIVEPY